MIFLSWIVEKDPILFTDVSTNYGFNHARSESVMQYTVSRINGW